MHEIKDHTNLDKSYKYGGDFHDKYQFNIDKDAATH